MENDLFESRYIRLTEDLDLVNRKPEYFDPHHLFDLLQRIIQLRDCGDVDQEQRSELQELAEDPIFAYLHLE